MDVREGLCLHGLKCEAEVAMEQFWAQVKKQEKAGMASIAGGGEVGKLSSVCLSSFVFHLQSPEIPDMYSYPVFQ